MNIYRDTDEEQRQLKLPLEPNGHDLIRDPEFPVEVHRLEIEGKEPVTTIRHIFYRCTVCGEYPDVEVTDDSVIVKNPCPCPNGIITETILPVPSGKIIVTDDLRSIYDGFKKEGLADYNTALGQAQVIEAMADLGCAFGCVLNTCPGLYKAGTDRYIIANFEYDEKTDGLPSEEENLLAGIITDLWAYSIADYEDWKSRGGTPENTGCYTVVDIPPGNYKFTYHGGEPGFDPHGEGTVIFAHIEKV